MANEFTLQESPRAVGTYWIGGVHVGLGVHMARRPAWLHRIMMRWLLGWVWVDAAP